MEMQTKQNFKLVYLIPFSFNTLDIVGESYLQKKNIITIEFRQKFLRKYFEFVPNIYVLAHANTFKVTILQVGLKRYQNNEKCRNTTN